MPPPTSHGVAEGAASGEEPGETGVAEGVAVTGGRVLDAEPPVELLVDEVEVAAGSVVVVLVALVGAADPVTRKCDSPDTGCPSALTTRKAIR